MTTEHITPVRITHGRRVVVILFAACLAFNVLVGLIIPLRSFFAIRRFEKVRPGMALDDAQRVFGRLQPDAIGKAKIKYLVPMVFVDSDTCVTIGHNDGIVQGVDLPWHKGSAIGVLLVRLQPTALFVLALVAFVWFGNTLVCKQGVSLLAGIGYAICFSRALMNMIGLILILYFVALSR